MAQKRINTNYPGVYYLVGTNASGKPERMYYIRYRLDGKTISDRVGWQFKDAMTPARAARIRAAKIEGRELSNTAKREAAKKKERVWTVDRLWQERIRQKSLKSIAQEESRYRLYIKPALGNKKPKDILPLDVDRIKMKLKKQGKSPQTIKLTLSQLRTIINFGVKKQLCPALSFTIEMPKVSNEKTEDLSPDQLSNLLAAIEADHDKQAGNLMLLALFTGMRRGELFRLKWEHIDFDRGFITLVDTKGGKPEVIPLNTAARGLLEGHSRSDSPFIFPGKNGRQRVEIRRPVNRIKKRAGLPDDFRPLHGLRHSYASSLASSGQVDLYTISKLLTHKSTAMTARYSHLRDSALKAAAELAGDIVNEAMNGTVEKVVSIDR